MAIPNTTPTPNELYNGEMIKMSDTELRVVLVVTRATLGWEIDNATGMRKQEDLISYWQLKKKTGRGYTSLAKAIENCIKQGWIEVRDKNEKILEKRNERIGKKLYYRLGRIFLDKVITSPESGEVEENKATSPESVITDSVITECKAYKRNTIQKKTYTKIADSKAVPVVSRSLIVNDDAPPSVANPPQNPDIKKVIDYFSEKVKRENGVKPAINGKKDGAITKKILKDYSFEDIKKIIDFYLDSKKVEVCGFNLSSALSTDTINKWLFEERKI